MSDQKETNGKVQFPKSQRVYVQGSRDDIRVPFREIELNPTRNVNNTLEENPPVRVYDSTGAWGDPTTKISSTDGLAAPRRAWIIERGDVEEYEGRTIQPQDDGYLTEGAREYAKQNARFEAYPGLRRFRGFVACHCAPKPVKQ
jgi:phosphomethylpyrimidine synthase